MIGNNYNQWFDADPLKLVSEVFYADDASLWENNAALVWMSRSVLSYDYTTGTW